jgi:hypothetical protein
LAGQYVRLFFEVKMTTPNKDAVPSELREAARQFHNLTQGDSTVIIRAPSVEKRDAIIAAGERLRAALAPTPAVQAEAVRADDDAKAKAAEFMVAARNATMFQDVRELISTMTDPNAKCPGRHLEAQRVLPLLDAFLGEGYTGRVIALKRALGARSGGDDAQSAAENADEGGPDFEDGPDEDGFQGSRPWNGFNGTRQSEQAHSDALAGDISPRTE